MLSGTIMLTLIPLISSPLTYLQIYIAAATWYGFGVGGECLAHSGLPGHATLCINCGL
jgi:hypothetical protein